MVQDDNRLAQTKQLRALGDAGLVHIHHHECCAVRHLLNGLLAVVKQIRGIFRVVPEEICNGLQRRGDIAQHDVRLPVHRPRDAIDADGGAEAVEIADPVPHDEDLILCGDDLLERLGLDPCLNPGVLLDLLGLAAVVDDVVRHFDHRLIAAAAKGKIDGVSRKLIVLRVGEAVHADADAQGDRHLVADGDGLDIRKKLEVGVLQLDQRLLAHDDQVLVLLDLAADAVDGGDVLIHLPVDEGSQERALDILHGVQCLLVVVHVDEADDNALIIDLLDGEAHRRLVEQVERDQRALVGTAVDHVAVLCQLVQGDPAHLHPVVAALVVDDEFHVVLARGQHILRERREHRGDLPMQQIVPVDDPLELVVHPDDPAGLIQHRVRQRQVLQELLLHLSVLGGKAHKLVHHQGAVVHVLIDHDGEVHRQKQAQHQAARPADEVDQEIDEDQEKSQADRHVEVAAHAALHLDMIAHLSIALSPSAVLFPAAGSKYIFIISYGRSVRKHIFGYEFSGKTKQLQAIARSCMMSNLSGWPGFCLPLGVRQDCNVSCSLDCCCQLSLMCSAGSRDSSGKDLSSLRDVLPKLGSILVIDGAVLSAENANFSLSVEIVLTSERLVTAFRLCVRHVFLQFLFPLACLQRTLQPDL